MKEVQMRSYTVRELDDLRRIVEHKWLYGAYAPVVRHNGVSHSRPYMENEKTRAVEEIVRTHMLAGHTADDLQASEAG